jgi:hypothetical protein
MFQLFSPGGRVGLVIIGGISVVVVGVAWLRMLRGDWVGVGHDVVACAWVGVIWFFLGMVIYKRRRIARMREVHCPDCGYDCSVTPRRCPECGRVVTGVDGWGGEGVGGLETGQGR